MSSLILTRFLYAKDEVELSLMMALLKNEDLRIIYYWAYELYYSGFDIFDLLLKIYLDYYYEKQPYLLSYIRKKEQLWKADGDMKHVAYVLRNIYNLQVSNTVFMARQYMFNYGKVKFDYQAGGSVCATIYDDGCGFGPTILYKIEGGGTYRQYFLRAVARRHMENVWYYLKMLLEKGDDGVVELVEEALSIVLDANIVKGKDTSLLTHYIIASIVEVLYKDTASATDAKKHIFVVPKKEHLDHIRSLEEEKIIPVYDTLMHKRFVSINQDIGIFALARDSFTDLVNEVWFHWEYYAMGAPLWQNRLSKWGGVVNHATKKIEFPTDEMQEAFYELYAYEFDELPKEVQAMSLDNTF
jgi:hypothetical protein